MSDGDRLSMGMCPFVPDFWRGELSVALPNLTPEQRAAALEKAAAARASRAEIKKRLKYQGAKVSEVVALAESDEAIAKLRVTELLESLPGIGKVKARRIMAEVGIAESRRVGGLGPHQVDKLISQFG